MGKEAKSTKKKKNTIKHDVFEARQKALLFDPPPILILPSGKNGKKKGENYRKPESDYKEIELMVDPTIPALGTLKRKVEILRNPSAEDWIKWLMEFEDICESKPIPDPRRKALAAPQFLADHAKEIWQKHYRANVAEI